MNRRCNMFIINNAPYNHITLELHEMLTYSIEKDGVDFGTPEEQYFVLQENLLDFLDDHESI